MITGVDETSASYKIGQLTGALVLVALIVYFVVWLVKRSHTNPKGAGAPVSLGRTPEMDLAVLATVLTVQAAHDVASALVARVLVQHPLLRMESESPAWSLSGGHPYMTLVPTPAGSVLRVQELEVPLPSPQPSVVWEWALAEVAQEAARAQIPTYRGQQALAPSRPIGPYSAVWAAVG